MKEAKSFSTAGIPKILNANDIAECLGISRSAAYNLLNSRSFPTLRIGKRMVVAADKFAEWIDNNSGSLKEGERS